MELSKRYDFKETEPRLQKFWIDNGFYKFDPKSKAKIYSCDTPPPTVSGKMHLGHALAYNQADYMMRYQRMLGKNIFYPWGFDDNGLATERFVEKKCNVKAQKMSRPEFVKLCLAETKQAEQELKDNWSSLGISPDWDINYRTIDKDVVKKSQLSFLDLNKKTRIYRKKTPFMWCPACQTAIAQVELKDKEKQSKFVYMKFDTSIGKTITIATTRPELMPACVAVFVNPKDKRYKDFIGKKAKIPFFNREVDIIANKAADMDFGSGVVYHCTFGDMDDVEWVEKYNLPIIEVLNKDGTLNKKTGKYEGLTTIEARREIIKDLEDKDRIEKIEPIQHVANVHERCDTEIEILMTEMWFIKYLDLKDKFLKQGAKLNWYPKHMKVRYDNWVKGLKWDWGISRQRFYGVPFPVWYCKKCKTPIFATEKELPVDPLVDKPKSKCPKCKSSEVVPDKDIMDTWATSSLTPMLPTRWKQDDEFFKKIFPMSLRSNGHDIITFWLFNTVVKSLLHENKLPWKDVMINGFVLDPKGKKMSKSKGNVIEPQKLIEKFGADALRFWAASTKLGDDIPFQEKELVAGQKFCTKLWNASRFVFMHMEDYDFKKPELTDIDRWMIIKLNKVIENSTKSLDKYEYFTLKRETENLFWHDFCDNYLEIVKERLYNAEKHGNQSRKSAQFTLYHVLLSILKLMAPIMPHITEEVYQSYFVKHRKSKSIHVSKWPKADKTLEDKASFEKGEMAIDIITQIRKQKSDHKVSLKKEVKKLIIECDDKTRKKLEDVLDAIKATMHIEDIEFGKGNLSCENFEIRLKVEL